MKNVRHGKPLQFNNVQEVRTFGKQIQLKTGINIQGERNDGKQLQLEAEINRQKFPALGTQIHFEACINRNRDQQTSGSDPWQTTTVESMGSTNKGFGTLAHKYIWKQGSTDKRF